MTPTRAIPTSTIPSRPIPTRTIPTRTIPTRTIPTRTKPTRAIPTSTIPTSTKPTCTKPTRTIPTRTKPSRDREGAVPLHLRYKNLHRLPLPFHYVSNRRSNVVPIPQPPRTSVPRPPLSIRSVRLRLVQSPACVRLEITHHLLRFRVCLHHCMNVICPYVRRQKCPSAVEADVLYHTKHRVTAGRVQQIRSLVHEIALARCTRQIGIKHAMSRNVVVPIHGTGFVAVQMGAVARERNQVRHRRLVYTAPSRSRLGRMRSRLGSSRHRKITLGWVT
jgi:hypothetical protein